MDIYGYYFIIYTTEFVPKKKAKSKIDINSAINSTKKLKGQ